MNRIIKILTILLAVGLVSPVVEAQKPTRRTTTTQKKSATRSKKSNQRKNTRKATTPNVSNKDVAKLKSQRDALQKKISQSQAQLAKNDKEVKKQLSHLAQINGQIDQHQKNIGRIKGQLDSVNNNIGELEQQLADLAVQLASHRKKYARSMLYMYQNRKSANKMLFILSSGDFTQMVRRYRYVKDYSKYQRLQGQLVQRKQTEIEQAKDKLTQERNRQTQLLQSEQEENRLLSVKQTEQRTAVNRLQKKQKELQNVLASSRKEMAALNSKIDYYVKLAIEQERKRREAAERQARERAERQRREEADRKARNEASAKTAKTTSSVRSQAKTNAPAKPTPQQQYQANDKEYKLTSDFASNRGRLPMPITGSYVVSTRYGSYTLPGMNVRLDSKGINLTGHGGAQARCIFDGEVSAIFSAGGMKNVMVRHGSYISIYCNLVSVSVHQGQRVSARQTLGAVAADASGKPNLHFQLRKETATLNPEQWLAR